MALNLYCLFDPIETQQLLPLAYTRPVSAFRVGIRSIHEKWESALDASCATLTRPYLSAGFSSIDDDAIDITYINGSLLPDSNITDPIKALSIGQRLIRQGKLLACRVSTRLTNLEELYKVAERQAPLEYAGEIGIIDRTWDIVLQNAQQISADIDAMGLEAVNGRARHALSIRNEASIYIHKTAQMDACILNATKGPIYIGENAHIMDGATLIGPVAIGANSVIKAGAKIYGNTALGPHCKVGGEVASSVLFGYSNKGHDGYMGNSVLGHWCNLGADTNTSNLKNNYSMVKCWDYITDSYRDSGQQFVGVVMGDHSKTGINTMLNTGTVVGVAANIFGGGFPPKFVPSFSWGGAHGMQEYRLEKALETAEMVMARRSVQLSDHDRKVLNYILQHTAKYRTE